jgi:hypothetical protein
MTREQMKVVRLVCWAVAAVLFTFIVIMDPNGGGVDELSDVMLGLVAPIVLVGASFFIRTGPDASEK